eukprot:scaffold116327_cov37-Prasinocladus_malaysianus.AAC.2
MSTELKWRDLRKLATDVGDKVGRRELQQFMERAVQRSIEVYTRMQQEQEAAMMITSERYNTLLQ